MTTLLEIACRTIRRRLEQEAWEGILRDYPRLTAEEVAQIKRRLGQDKN